MLSSAFLLLRVDCPQGLLVPVAHLLLLTPCFLCAIAVLHLHCIAADPCSVPAKSQDG